MRSIYLILTIIGFIAPNVFVVMVSVETGNIMLWLDPMVTLGGMFGNLIATAFVVDLLVAVFVFFIWSYQESSKLRMKKPYLIWILTMLFGMAGALPLFLYQRESYLPINLD